MDTSLPRMILCIKDIMKITGKSKRTAERIMSHLRKKYPEQTKFGISVTLFSTHTGIPYERIIRYLI